MRRDALAFVAFLLGSALAGLPAAAHAQLFERSGNDLGGAASTLMAQQFRVVQYRVVSGRLRGEALTASNLNHTSLNQNPARSERMTLEIAGGVPTIHYELRSEAEEVKIDLLAGTQFTIHRLAKKPGEATFDFEQPASGDLTLAIGTEPERRVVTAPNLWRLAIADEALCRKTLFPLLQTIRPNWNLAATASGIEEALFRFAGANLAADHKLWKVWVDDLGSDKFSRRTAAQRKLVEAGPAVTPFLEALVPASLDPEQRERVRALIERFDRSGDDSVDLIAISLAADAETWLSLFSRSNAARRKLAARQLAECLDRPVDIDPGADAKTRAEQVARLRAQLQAGAVTPSE